MQAWQQALANAITDPVELLNELKLDTNLIDGNTATLKPFVLRVPRGFVARMQKGNPQDPLLLQVLPTTQELDHYPGYSQDPLGEKRVNPVAGLLHKYHGRALLTVAGGCAINCRYCFRRHFPYQNNTVWQQALAYIANDTSITEVILSGGDPLILKDTTLTKLIHHIEAINHIKRLRIHTRLPIVIPERITTDLIQLIQATRLMTIMVLHCNHPYELDVTVSDALAKLHRINVTLLNQAVLLKKINDDANILIALSHKLFTTGMLPYYLHLLDQVQGAGHFAVTERHAKKLLQIMTDRLPGYLVPKLVREVAGARAKVAIQ